MPNPDVPAIDTERLTLRGHTLADFPECAAMWADQQVVRYVGGRPATSEEAWARLLRNFGLWAGLGFGYWVVRERGTGRFVGEVGFAEFNRDVAPPLDGPEMGWVLAAAAHGQGYATEAVRAALAWGDLHLPARLPAHHRRPMRIQAIISPANAPSLRVAEKCGFRPCGETAYKGEPTLVFERTRR